MKTSSISARIDPELKRNVEHIFHQLGLTSSQAITLFYHQVEIQRGLPFSLHIPNETTRQAIQEARNRDHLASYENIDALFHDMDTE